MPFGLGQPTLVIEPVPKPDQPLQQPQPPQQQSDKDCCKDEPMGIHFDLLSRFDPKLGVRLFVYKTTVNQQPPENVEFLFGFKFGGEFMLASSAADEEANLCRPPRCPKTSFRTFFQCTKGNPTAQPREPCIMAALHQAYKLETHLKTCLRRRAKEILDHNSIDCTNLSHADYIVMAMSATSQSSWVVIPCSKKRKRKPQHSIVVTKGIESFDITDFKAYAEDRMQYYNILNNSSISLEKSVVVHIIDFKSHGLLVHDAIEVLVGMFGVSSNVRINYKELELQGSAVEIEDALCDVADAVFETDMSVLNVVFTEEDEDISMAISELNQIGALVVTVTDNNGEYYESKVKSVPTEDVLIAYCTTQSGQRSGCPRDVNQMNWVCSRNENVKQVSTSLTSCFVVALASAEYLWKEDIDHNNIKKDVSQILSSKETGISQMNSYHAYGAYGCCKSEPLGIHFDRDSRFYPRMGVRLFVYQTTTNEPPENVDFQLGFYHQNQLHLLASSADICVRQLCRNESTRTFFQCTKKDRSVQPRVPCREANLYQAYDLKAHSITCLRQQAKETLYRLKISYENLRSAPYVVRAISEHNKSDWVVIPTRIPRRQSISSYK
eukprot:TRINITY_DN3298_c0_g1_i2.p1 TRINITY_DN3298_c0_g1~~TRINITY_DN3298_c0_g1_i2.p1  ORF type:complete len:630 (-),score=78.84 TRINITY_DN3298_c0_g1_i2:62-1888(-)